MPFFFFFTSKLKNNGLLRFSPRRKLAADNFVTEKSCLPPRQKKFFVSVIWLETSSSTSGKFEACFFGPHSPHEIAAFGVEQKFFFPRNHGQNLLPEKTADVAHGVAAQLEVHSAGSKFHKRNPQVALNGFFWPN